MISDDAHNLLYYKKSDGKNFDVPPERLYSYDSKSDADYKGFFIIEIKLIKSFLNKNRFEYDYINAENQFVSIRQIQIFPIGYLNFR